MVIGKASCGRWWRRRDAGSDDAFAERVQERYAAGEFLQSDRFRLQDSNGLVFHTVAFGTEYGRQTGLSQRNTGLFPNNGNKTYDIVNPFNPTYFGPVNFTHLATDANSTSSTRRRPTCRTRPT